MGNSLRHNSGVFISYARSDGAAFAQRLRQQLEKRAIRIWQDRVGLEGGRDWWLQITQALDHVEFMVLVLTPNAVESEMVRKEWRYARQQGICIYPVKGALDLDFNRLPRWMRDVQIYDLGSLESKKPGIEWQKFLNDLNTTPQVRRVPFMAEDVPEDFVPRPSEFERLKQLLLDRQRAEAVAITAALRGAGGYGKTILARALCHDEEIQEAFDDGVLWVTLGEHPGELTARVENLIRVLSGANSGFTNIEACISRLVELLTDRDILFVIDDVWSRDQLRPFLQGGARCARLITTRNLDAVPATAQTVKVDAMQPSEAVALLSAGLPAGGAAQRVEELRKLAARLGEWPLLLKLVNGALRHRVNTANQDPTEALNFISRALDKRGLSFFDASDAVAREQSVKKTIGVSLERLKSDECARYFELAVFPEDVNVPLANLERYWRLDEFECETLCERLHKLSLLLNFDLTTRTIRLHDVLRRYLIDEQRDRLRQFHQQLLDAHCPLPRLPYSLSPAWAALPEDDHYLWDYLAFHLCEAERGAELVATVKDWRYLAQKTVLRKVHAVENDLVRAGEIASDDLSLRALRRGIAVSSHLLARCANRRDVEATLFSRLQHLDEVKPILQNMAKCLDRPYIAPFREADLPDLPHRALLRRLEGHLHRVKDCAISPNGALLASASKDGTLKIWDLQNGEMLRTLGQHREAVDSCAFSPDGTLIISAPRDDSLKVWDVQTGDFRRSLGTHLGLVDSCEFSADGRLIVSASNDGRLAVQNVETGQTLRILKGHSGPVNGCAFSPDGKRILSGSADQTLKIWDVETGRMLHTLKGHSNSVNGCAFSRDGKLILSASADQTLRVWDAETGKLIRTLVGHSLGVNDCAISPDGKLAVSASDDKTLKVWDVQGGEMLRSFQGHSGPVFSCAFSPDGKLIASAADDRTLGLWEVDSDEVSSSGGRPRPSSDSAINLQVGLIVSRPEEGALTIWDAQSGEMLRMLEEPSDSLLSFGLSPDGNLVVSVSFEGKLTVWDAQTGQMLRTLKSHARFVDGGAINNGGQLIACCYSFNDQLKVWDSRTRKVRWSFKGDALGARRCAFSPDGKLLVSAWLDGKVRVYDLSAGKILHLLEGHSDSAFNCAFSTDGTLIISTSNDKTLKVWNAQRGNCVATFYADGYLDCCAIHGEVIVAAGSAGWYYLRMVS